MTPTPEEKCELEATCKKCDIRVIGKCEHYLTCPECKTRMLAQRKIYHTDPCTWEDCPICSPSPEARVDWENKAREIAQVAEFKKKPTIEELETILNSPEGRNVVILPDGSVSNSNHETNLVKRIAKALSNAFEKGREAR